MSFYTIATRREMTGMAFHETFFNWLLTSIWNAIAIPPAGGHGTALAPKRAPAFICIAVMERPRMGARLNMVEDFLWAASGQLHR